MDVRFQHSNRQVDMQKPLNFKLVLLGESAVGKSSIVLRFVKQQFAEDRESTIGAAFLTQQMKIAEDLIKFEIWDTAGQERYKSLAPMYYRYAHAALVVYSVGSKDSLDRAVKWIEELKRQADSNTIIILAGNKSDIPDNTKQVANSDVEKLCEELDVSYHATCSAKSGAGINELFLKIGQLLPIQQAKDKLNNKSTQSNSIRVDDENLTKNKDSCVC
ncbi:ras-domain-containing protein [Wallemia mellicola]|nr:ras-domain-containing protein [Wallemia mellicola]TIC35012.1 ras-domain-containing protein [Wallemia mellicola]TIC39982.1 ras-domain-containing protein [Wallemia mellicola]